MFSFAQLSILRQHYNAIGEPLPDELNNDNDFVLYPIVRIWSGFFGGYPSPSFKIILSFHPEIGIMAQEGDRFRINRDVGRCGVTENKFFPDALVENLTQSDILHVSQKLFLANGYYRRH